MDFFKPFSPPSFFRIFQIVVPTIAGIIFFIILCRCFCQCRKRREDQRQLAPASARALEPPPPVYIIPVSGGQEQRHGPPTPRYNLPQQYPPPPAYTELMPKPDFPSAPPPAYTEAVSSPINPSAPGQITPSCPPLPQ